MSKADGSQVHDLQLDALTAASVAAADIYSGSMSGGRDDWPELDAGLKVLTGQGADIDTTTAAGKLIFASMAEFERSVMRERTMAGLASARARGRVGGRSPALTKWQVRQAQASMGKPETVVSELAKELGVSRARLYRYVEPNGALREQGKAVLKK